MLQNHFIASRASVRLAFCCALVLQLLVGVAPFPTSTQATLHAQSPIAANEGLSHVSWSEAEKVVGTVALVSGKIIDTGKAGRVNFLNFDSRRDVFKVVVFKENLQRFPRPLDELYLNKLVVVRGMVTRYKDVPQIEVVSMDQIQVVDQLPPTKIVRHQKVAVGETIQVATLNIRNLYDDVDDPYTNDETTQAKPRSELERVAATIRAVNADVLALQEVESRGYLQRFNNVFLQRMGYEVVHYAGNDGRGSGLAVLSRVPVGAVTSNRHRRFPDAEQVMRKFSRDLLCVELTPKNASPFEIWVTHLKSKRGGADATAPQRLAEASEIRRILDQRLEADANRKIILVGDFNDTFASETIQKLLGDGDAKLTTYWNAGSSKAVTYNLEPYREMIDFILCSPAAAQDYVPRSYTVMEASLQQSGSDHNPVMARFRFSR